MPRKKVLFLILSAAVIVGLLVFSLGLFKPKDLIGFFTDKNDAAEKVVKLYELVNPDAGITVEKIEEVNGVYKVLLKAVDASGGVVYREVYVTKDGELLSESMIIVSKSISQITGAYNFVDCLQSKGMLIFGLSNDTATTLQFNILGGRYATKLFVGCDDERAQQCVDAGITQVPTVVYQNKGYAGIQSKQSLENLTGCA
ncbi:MAG: hypothetical protein HYT70_00255 [Candidatus Aenigmarchaeota archaeon]|nr:hypothetical protein [Candidatus Aenigmarchaeota archaeon]